MSEKLIFINEKCVEETVKDSDAYKYLELDIIQVRKFFIVNI